jgi:cell division protein FtsL
MATAASRKIAMAGTLRSQKVRSRRNVRDMGFIYTAVFCASICLMVLCGYIWSRITVVSMGYAISSANVERDALIEQNRRLTIEFERLKSPERIEGIASRELNLVNPRREQVVDIR